MADHSEHVGDAPVHHRLDHHVRDGRGGRRARELDVDAVLADLHGKRLRRIGEAAGRRRPVIGS